MSRCIDADEAMRLLIEKMPSGMKKSIVSIMNKVPTIEPRCEECEAFNKTRLLIPQPERKNGKWINAQYPFSKCSICECYFDTENNIGNYCPNCGAEMEGQDDR